MSWLEAKGAEAAIATGKRWVTELTATAVRQINTHTTKETEQIMTELNRLSGAVDRELADDAAQNELIAELKTQLAAATAAAEDAAAGEADAADRLEEALAAATQAAERLESNDPVDPNAPHPDQTLPGDLVDEPQG